MSITTFIPIVASYWSHKKKKNSPSYAIEACQKDEKILDKSANPTIQPLVYLREKNERKG